jgi:hypothetical protein
VEIVATPTPTPTLEAPHPATARTAPAPRDNLTNGIAAFAAFNVVAAVAGGCFYFLRLRK